MSELEPQPSHPHASRRLIAAGLAITALLGGACSGYHEDVTTTTSKPPSTEFEPPIDNPPYPIAEQNAIDSLIMAGPDPDDKPYVWDGLLMVSAGAAYYDAPVVHGMSIEHRVPEGSVMSIDRPRLTEDDMNHVTWFAFTIGGESGLANSPQHTYWLPLSPSLQPLDQEGKPLQPEGSWQLYKYPTSTSCEGKRGTHIDDNRNLVIEDDTPAAIGDVTIRPDFDRLVQQRQLVTC